MILLGNVLIGLGYVISGLLSLVMWIIIIQALLSWVNPDPWNPIVRFLNEVSEPLLRPVRRFVPILGGGIDISPIILIFLIIFLRVVIGESLIQYGESLRIGRL